MLINIGFAFSVLSGHWAFLVYAVLLKFALNILTWVWTRVLR
jgi:hypothetical protein